MGEGGHSKGVNCIDFYGGSDRPFLVTGSDDQTVRVWDYHTKNCVRVLEGHTDNVSTVIFHPQLPFLLSAGEDATLRIWNAQTFRPEASYNFGMDRAWGLACCRAHNSIGIAFDSGSVVFQLGRGDPCASLDSIQGRLVWSRARGSGSAGSHGNEILTGMVRLLDVEGRPIRVPADGEIIPLTPKELGTSDVFPQNLQHSPDGRLVAVWGDGEYVIYSTIGWRNRAFGKGTEIAWAAPGGDIFAARDSNGRVTINRVSAHDQGAPLRGVSNCDKIYGGPLLGVSVGGSTLSFFDWTGDVLVRTIDVSALSVSWSPDASHVAIQTESSCYILSAKSAVIKSPQSFESGEEGIEDSLELVDELEQSVKSVAWISGNCFVYLTEENRLAYHVVGGDADESFQLALFDRSHYLLGFLPGEQRIYLTDQDLQISSYAIMPSLITFQSAVLTGGDLTKSLGLLESIPVNYHARLAVFLQRRGYLREALKISPDAHFQFELAIQLNDLNLAREILQNKMSGESSKWQELGQVALKCWNLPIAEEALIKAGDLASLFLLYAAAGDVDGLIHVAREAAKKSGHVNLAFAAYVKAGAYIPAFELLLSEGRAPEAALFARTYGLSVESVTKAVELWRLTAKKDRVGTSLADPSRNPEKFSNVQFGCATGISIGSGAPATPRGRSVSFDGNVSVAGSSSTISLKQPTEIIPEPEASTSPVFVDEATSMTSERYQTDASDDQMSLEVNTAGTGTRLEDLDEETASLGAGLLDDIEEMEMEPDFEGSIVEKAAGSGDIEDVEDIENADGADDADGEDIEDVDSEDIDSGTVIESEYITVPEGEAAYEGNYAEYEGAYELEQELELEEASVLELEEATVTDADAVVDAVTDNVVEPFVAEPFSVFEADLVQDALLSELETLHVTDSFNESILDIVEDGGDVYDVNEAEYPEGNDEAADIAEYIEYPATESDLTAATEYAHDNEITPEDTTDSYAYFDYPTTTAAAPNNEDDYQFESKKEKGSDGEDGGLHEEIDFGGDGDADGWL